MDNSLCVSIEVALGPEQAFSAMLDELSINLARLRLRLEMGAQGRVLEAGGLEVGRVVAWDPPRRVAFEWRAANWMPDQTSRVELAAEPSNGGSRVSLCLQDWGGLPGDAEEFVGWFAGQVAAPLLRAASSTAFADWVTDRAARRPSGRRARNTYRDPLYHYPGFHVILAELALTPKDHLLDIGCGGGAFLKEAALSGCRATGVDYNLEMVHVARDLNRDGLLERRLDILQAEANRLPFAEGVFSCASMHGVLGFLPDPVTALAEMRRVLRPSGRVMIANFDPEIKGTPACPEPMASRAHFYDDDALLRLGRSAGFETVTVLRRDLEPYARKAGIPEAHIFLYAGHPGRFLWAWNR
jgi:SAM-dependent methyltransferase